MTRKEKTAKLLYDWLTTLIDSTITESWEEEYKMSPSFRAYVDTIISIPLNIPTDEEIEKEIKRLEGVINSTVNREKKTVLQEIKEANKNKNDKQKSKQHRRSTARCRKRNDAGCWRLWTFWNS